MQIAGAPSISLRFLYRDAQFPEYTYEHQKVFLKHGDTIYLFDYATDNRDSFSVYLQDMKNLLNTVEFNSPAPMGSNQPPIGTVINMTGPGGECTGAC
jgi:hypothetical protein